MFNITDLHKELFEFLYRKHTENNDFRFTVTGRESEYRAGRYFYGTTNSIFFSCWRSTDNQEKKPSIYVLIENDGTITLNVIAKNPNWKAPYFQILADELGLNQLRGTQGEPINHWRKFYIERGTPNVTIQNCLDMLDRRFFTNNGSLRDKDKIDDLVVEHSSKLGNTHFKILSKYLIKETFDTLAARIQPFLSKNIIEEVNEPLESYLKFNHLSLNNIGLIRHADNIDFDKNVTCFIGKNGTGKTTILRAIILALTGYNNPAVTNDDDAIEQIQNMLHIKGVENGNILYSEQGYTELQYSINEKKCINKVNILCEPDEETPEIRDNEGDDFVAHDYKKFKSLVLAFPQVQGDRMTKKNALGLSDVISMLNNQADNRFYKFADWLISVKTKANDKREKNEDNSVELALIKTIFEIISEVSDEKITLYDIIYKIGYEEPDIWVNIGENSEPILLKLISQGFNGIFGWIGYMLQRLYEETPENTKNDFMQTKATVLVDEIDTFLHTSLQQRILPVLVKKFPNIQFIVTTHSPYVVGSIPNDKIKIYVCKKEGESVEVEEFTDFTAYGADVERLSERIFGTQGRIGSIGNLLETINKLIGCNDYTTAMPYIETITAELPEFSAFINENQNNITQMDILIIAEKAIDILKNITDKNDPDLFAMQSFINTKRRLRNRRAHETH